MTGPAAFDELVARATGEPFDAAAFGRAFASAPRHLGAGDEAARIELLRRAAGLLAPGAFEALVGETYVRGDSREKAAVLRALSSLPDPARFARLGVDACRTNERPLFEAIACDNPFPAEHFSELAFNQMALKAVFIGAPVGRIVGLGRRRTPELARMAAGYASERRAAGRTVPDDVALLLGEGGTA